MPEKRPLLLASSFLLPFACVGHSLPADKEWSGDVRQVYAGGWHVCHHERSRHQCFRRHLAQPAVRRDGCFRGSSPELSVSMDVIYTVLAAAKNRFDIRFDQWTIEPVVQYEITRWLSP